MKALFNDNIINALGWSLFHTLWQGIILAVFIGVILHLLRHKSSQIRYFISVSTIFIIVGLSVYHFIHHFDNSFITADDYSEQIGITTISESQFVDLSDLNAHNKKQISLNLVVSKVQKISKYFPVIVKFWLIGILFFLVKFIVGYFYTQRLRTHGIWTLSENWIQKFEKIKSNLKISKKIQYLESQVVRIPMVVGYFKPVILIPTEMLTGIPTEQIESIIAHELAHIKRNDYIINVLLSIIETVFFFHPAVWYLSNKIRDERENCCDDIALSVINDSLAYAKALVSIQELTLNKHYSAVAFSGRKKHLLNRIKRMIMKPKSKSNRTDKIIASLVILSAIMTLSFTYSATKEDNRFNHQMIEHAKTDQLTSVQTTIEASPVVVLDTITINHKKINIQDNTVIKTIEKNNGKKQVMKFTLKNGQITELYIDGKKIPENEHEQYQAEIDQTINDLKHAKDDVRKAMEEIKQLDVAKIQKEVEESMKDFHVDMEKMEIEMAKAMEDIESINLNEIMKTVEMNLDQLEDFHFDFDMDGLQKEMHEVRKHIRENIDTEEIRREMENVRRSIEQNIDKEEIQKQIQKAQEELSKIDMEEIKLQVEKNLQEFETYDKQKTIDELENKLQELEELELEEK